MPYFKISSDDYHKYAANTYGGEELNYFDTLDYIKVYVSDFSN